MLNMNDGDQEHKRLLGECVQDFRAVEGRLAKTYIEVIGSCILSKFSCHRNHGETVARQSARTVIPEWIK